ncbi:MAG TPA: 5,6-dimethylbenzimidazole synthase [Acidimicrobiales bacterium]|nr:5,6-dimethylbenzimidazole synthase [Acidimicrobiales bacterium]
MTWPRPVPLVGDTTSAAERAAEPAAWRLADEQRKAVYEVIAGRRDVRRFRPDPIEPSLLEQVLMAGHRAPSVGHSQPWRFVVVTAAATRDRAATIAERERLRQAHLLHDDARRRMLDLQLDGIREAPIGVVVACDRRAPAAGVLGRATYPDTDIWSCACAIENMWLAARAEGLGMGWVTLFPPAELAALVALPPGVVTLGWLCLGWPDERPPAPALERAGWSRRLALSDVTVRESWPAVPAGAPAPPVSALRAPDQAAVVAARDESDRLLTAPGSLGVLDKALARARAIGIEDLASTKLIVVGADHPVTAHRVSTYPASVTRDVLEATVAGVSLGAAAARAAGFGVIAVDAGVNGPPVGGATNCRPRGRRGDLVYSDAMTLADTEALINRGRHLGQMPGTAAVALGEVGIGNTTVAATLVCALLDLPATDVVGLGAGGDTATLERKTTAVAAAVARSRAKCTDPVAVLAALGGPEFAVLAGIVLGAAEQARAVLLDGLATSVAALVAARLKPAAAAYLIAGQRSREKAHAAVLDELGLEPILDLRARAGEGVGAVLCGQLLATALRLRALAGRTSP